MRNTFDPYTWHNNLYFRWTALPVLAHLFSWMTGMGGIILFPVLVTIAQYLILKIHPAVVRPGIWFFTLPLTFFIWVKWGPVPGASRSGDVILNGVNAYYLGQLVNTIFIPLVIRKEKSAFLLNWLLSMVVAWVVWIVLYKLLITVWSGDKLSNAGNFVLTTFIMYPAIALTANAVSGFVLESNRLIVGGEED